MGMMDEKRYLTGSNGLLNAGDVFHLHGCKVAGMVRKPGTDEQTTEVALLVSMTGADEQVVVYTTGAAIVGQVQRVDAPDRQKMTQPGGWTVRLGQLPARPGQTGAFILEDATEHAADEEAVAVAHEVTEQQASPGPTPGAPVSPQG